MTSALHIRIFASLMTASNDVLIAAAFHPTLITTAAFAAGDAAEAVVRMPTAVLSSDKLAQLSVTASRAVYVLGRASGMLDQTLDYGLEATALALAVSNLRIFVAAHPVPAIVHAPASEADFLASFSQMSVSACAAYTSADLGLAAALAVDARRVLADVRHAFALPDRFLRQAVLAKMADEGRCALADIRGALDIVVTGKVDCPDAIAPMLLAIGLLAPWVEAHPRMSPAYLGVALAVPAHS